MMSLKQLNSFKKVISHLNFVSNLYLCSYSIADLKNFDTMAKLEVRELENKLAMWWWFAERLNYVCRSVESM